MKYSCEDMVNRLRILGCLYLDDAESLMRTLFSKDVAINEWPEFLDVYDCQHIEDHVFSYCANLALTSLPPKITSIGVLAFRSCANLALSSLPDGLVSIGHHAFDGCKNIKINTLPNGITSITTCVFNNCHNITVSVIPAGVTSMDNQCFGYCTGLTALTFKGTPDAINSNAFSGCTNLTTINVPWAEGEVANAPWGATNATINYNYTEG